METKNDKIRKQIKKKFKELEYIRSRDSILPPNWKPWNENEENIRILNNLYKQGKRNWYYNNK